jgi:hypothetical protein
MELAIGMRMRMRMRMKIRVRMRRMRRLNRTTENINGKTRRWSTDKSTKTTPKWNWQLG